MSVHRFVAGVPLMAGVLCAQQLGGRLEGALNDPQGAAVPGASVVATHQETNTKYESKSSGTGAFAIPNVRLGRYTISAEAAGFRRAVVKDVLVEVGGTAAVTINLEVGTLQEAVTVTAEGAQLTINTVDAELGTVVDTRRVLELPLNGRNAVELALQQAGVHFERTPDGEGDKFFVHGQRHRAISMTLDGIDALPNYNRASSTMIDQPLLAMAAENVQEFRVITGLSSAEYGRGGAQISAVTRSGSNEFHGSLFWFNRNNAFSANEFFNNAAIPRVTTPPLNRNQFGGRLGGPILRNRTFFYTGYQQTRESRGNSVNRVVYTSEARQGTFRFLDGLASTPRNVAASPDRVRSVNLLACGGSAATTLRRDCLDSRFTAARPPTLDPFITGKVFAAIPLPNNQEVGDGLNTGGFRFNARSLTVEHLPSTRLDHRISDRHTFYGTFNYIDRNIVGDYVNDREPQYPALGSLGDRVTHSRGFSAGLVSTLRPTLVNEFRIGRLAGTNAFAVNQPFNTPFVLDLNTINDPYDPGNGTEGQVSHTYHMRNVVNWIRGSHQVKAGVEWRQRYADFYGFDLVTAAGDIGFDDDNNPPGFAADDLNRLAGARAIHSNDEETARDLMNNLVGAMGQVSVRYVVKSLTSGYVPGTPDRRIYQNRELDWFVNDTWRAGRNLTLNLGLRWEYASVPWETRGLALAPQGGLSAVFGVSGPGGFFNPGRFDGTPCNELEGLPRTVTTANAVNLITGCATKYYPAASKGGPPIWKNDWNNFAPVVSLAWDPFGDSHTSVRAGFRTSFTQDAFSIVAPNLSANQGLRVQPTCVVADGTCLQNPLLLRDLSTSAPPMPPIPAFALPSSRSILDSSTIDFRAYDQNLGTPYYNEWTVGISREVGGNWAFEARYVGNRGVALRRFADYNEMNIYAKDPVSGQTFVDAFTIAQRNLNCNRSAGQGARFDDASGAACITPNPLMTALIAGEASRLRTRTALVSALERNQTGQFVHALTQVESSAPAAGQARIRGGSFWGQVLAGRFPVNFFQANPFVATARAMINDGSSTYHSLEIEVRRRFAQGLSLQGNYTRGKALADFDGDSNDLLNGERPSPVRFPRYNRGEHMPRHQFNVNWVYELPFGAGKPYLKGALAGKVFGGWQVSGLLNMRSGLPGSVVSGVGTFVRNALSGGNTVDLTKNATAGDIRALTGRRDVADGVLWFDPCLSGFLGSECTDSRAAKGLFALPQSGLLGQLGQSVLFGPRRFLVDMGLMKRTRIAERKDFEVRWEVFNVFNTVNFALPGLNVTAASFGRITRTVNNPRLMQFALKVNF
ncbi:MAG: carboxypeptidase regulatory-like domain-containing protein [Acidobacteriota bacterium]